ncbi:MAG: thioredoxin family protein [Pygmaiobacter sp.]|jgi:small redox-active disulfide protein 2|nr:thioredoxin family protein [Pygmaiobacter sp.]
MGLFGKKKKEEVAAPCECGGACESKTEQDEQNATILVLGGGCAKCNQLEAAVRQAMDALGLKEAVGHVTDFTEIAAAGVMTTPALMIDGKVVSSGRVLSKGEALELLKKARQGA